MLFHKRKPTFSTQSAESGLRVTKPANAAIQKRPYDFYVPFVVAKESDCVGTQQPPYTTAPCREMRLV